MLLTISLFTFIIIENTSLGLLLLRWIKHRNYDKTTDSRYTYSLNPNPKFTLSKSDKYFVKQKTFIETPEIGAYFMRLYFVKEHRHMKTSSILYILKGSAKVTLNGITSIIKPGDFLYVPARIPHHWEVIKPDQYVEYLEINTPSFAQTQFKDTIWS